MDHVVPIHWLKFSGVADYWFLEFHLVFAFTFSKVTSACNFLFISNSEADVPELFLVVHSTNVAKYILLLSSLHSCRVFLMVWKALSTNPLLWGNSGLTVLCMKSHDLEDFLNSYELHWRSIATKYYFGYAMLCKYTSPMGNDCIWWGIW